MVPDIACIETIERDAAAQLLGVDVHRVLVLDDVPRGLRRLRRIGGVEVVATVGEAEEAHGAGDLRREDEGFDAVDGVSRRAGCFRGVCLVAG
jgi:beta-phosphoglucomutase-like phosphatase (HAD superfamily)